MPGSQEMVQTSWIRVLDHSGDERLHRALAGELGAGEAAAIALAVALKADLVLMDDRQGRAAAERLDLPVTGTLGVLVAAKRSGFVDELAPILTALAAADAWLSPSLRRSVLEAVGESPVDPG